MAMNLRNPIQLLRGLPSHNKGAYVFPGTSDGILQSGAAYY